MQLGSCSSNSDSTEGGISHTRVGAAAKLRGRLDLDASCFALPRLMSTLLQALARLVGRTRGRRHRSPLRRRSSHEGCEPLTLWAPGRSSSTRLASFHRWLLVLLVCVMVFPTNGSAAPGFPWQTSINEAQAEPGYKYSYYEVLPPKAVYESVIICLLAVSAFIGLIVWVLKSNFEERQQKRMRREASLRERTSSVACLKT